MGQRASVSETQSVNPTSMSLQTSNCLLLHPLEKLLSHAVTVAPGSTPSCGMPALTTFHTLTARSTANIQPKNLHASAVLK